MLVSQIYRIELITVTEGRQELNSNWRSQRSLGLVTEVHNPRSTGFSVPSTKAEQAEHL